MNLLRLARASAASVLLSSALAVSAADFTFSGNVVYNTDIVEITFTLNADATNVKVWTDSFQGGVNYDPITALWRRSGSDYVLIDEDDDNDTIAPGQTYYDSGFEVASLAAGEYLFTVGAYPNFAYGTMLSEGFEFDHDGTMQVPIADWCQPASDGCTNQKGTFWRVNLSGVDSAEPPPVGVVPEPETYALMLAGLAAMGYFSRRRRARA